MVEVDTAHPPPGIEGEFQDYLRASRRWDASVRAAVPLFALYETGLLLLDGVEARNVADLVIREGLGLVGPWGMAGLNALVILALLVTLRWMDHGEPRPRVLALMFVESLVWAVMLIPLVALCEDAARLGIGVPAEGVFGEVVFGLGAGLWEELLFRLVFIGLIGLPVVRGLGLSPVFGASILVIASAFVFSWMHHAHEPGPIENLDLFLFRFLAGALLGLLYVVRGFGIACWTHASFDVLFALGLVR